MKEFSSPLDALLDEENNDNIVLYGENDRPQEFEQIAMIVWDGVLYAILKPLNMVGVAADEAFVFTIREIDGEDCLVIEEDEAILDAVFEQYYRLLRAEGVDVD
ncbi:MAG: DUF1292 domain-containing protein [Clostridia bacterium]|nr:DUF1292 domain-containing protein [Clostridia bacterium]